MANTPLLNFALLSFHFCDETKFSLFKEGPTIMQVKAMGERGKN
jgi:hypothetical protein